MATNKWILVGLALLLPVCGYAEKPKWVTQKNEAKQAGESVDWKAERDQWKASKKTESEMERSLEEDSDKAREKAKYKVKEKQDAGKAMRQDAEERKHKSKSKNDLDDDDSRQQGKPDLSGKMQDKPMKELDKGAEQGLQSREQRKKWWQFW